MEEQLKIMAEQLKLMAEQMKSAQERMDGLEKLQKSQKKEENAQSNDQLRPPTNPATILTSEMNFDVWFRMVTGELAALKYDDLLEEPQKNDTGEVNYDPEDEVTKGRINYVSTFLLARVDDSYKQSICELKLPCEMLKHIRDMRFPNLMSMRMTLERQWSNMIIAEGEDVLKFSNRFNEATKRLLASGTKLEPEKIVGNFCIAMKNRFPELCRRFDIQNNITFEEMKNLALSIESTEKESKARVDETSAGSASVSTVNFVDKNNANSGQKKNVVCFRCFKPGHLAPECRSQKLACYNCGKLGSHKAEECTALPANIPNNAKFFSGRVSKTYRNGNISRGGNRGSFGRGRARANSRGFGRGRFGGGMNSNRNVFRKVKLTGSDGKERFAMLSDVDGQIFELPEVQAVSTDGNFGDEWGTHE